MKKSNIGLIGLAVMGENLALNIESRGFTVSLYNRPHAGRKSVVDSFIEGRGAGKNFVATYSPEQFVESIERPRRIMLMVKAGAPVDEIMSQLVPYMAEGDVIIDGGNSDFHDTSRRVEQMEARGMYFVGTGISGGEQGALLGPSIMPGGSVAAWSLVQPVLQAIAAKLEDGTPCCQWIGGGGAGHFVKMVHNGIEYGDMQLIAEAYSLLKHRECLTNNQLSDIFAEWNRGDLDSFLVEITSDIMAYKDADGKFVVDYILDSAGQKGTGKLSSITAMDESNPLTLITEAVYARFLSAMKTERERASAMFAVPEAATTDSVGVEAVRQALYASKIISYAQGFSLMRSASNHYGWGLDFGAIAQIWREGCIIRSAFLGRITEAYQADSQLENLIFDDFFRTKITEALPAWRAVVADGVMSGMALPCMSAAMAYFDGLRTGRSSANLVQAQRDYFGAHTYKRTDAPAGQFFHTDWTGRGGKTISGSYNA